MIRTIEEARKEEYGPHYRSASYVEGRCVEGVRRNGSWGNVQCSRKNGYGPGGLYCKQHAKQIEEWGRKGVNNGNQN